VLAAREQQLALLIPELVGNEASYCRRLLDMTVLVLDPPDAADHRTPRPPDRVLVA
jgi:hypothetical protein